MASQIFTGTIPALMTPCTADRRPDFDALVRKGQELIAAGMSAVVYCGSMGDWPLLTDEQRMEGVERLVKAGIKVVVGTGAKQIIYQALGALVNPGDEVIVFPPAWRWPIPPRCLPIGRPISWFAPRASGASRPRSAPRWSRRSCPVSKKLRPSVGCA